MIDRRHPSNNPGAAVSERMTGRRAFLRSAALAALAVPAAPLLGRAATPALPGGGAPVVPESIRRIGRHYLVNGWVLTRADLEALNIEPV